MDTAIRAADLQATMDAELETIEPSAAAIAQQSWMEYCRRVADERLHLVLSGIPESNGVLRTLLRSLIDAERDHAKAQFVAEGR